MKFNFRIYLLSIVILFPIAACAQKNSTSVIYLKRYIGTEKANSFFKTNLEYSRSGNSYYFMFLREQLGANNAMIYKSYNEEVINYQLELIDNILNSAAESKQIRNSKSNYKDSYKGWVSLSKNRAENLEVPLYESYSFFYITQFLFYIKQNGWINKSAKNIMWFNTTLQFIEYNIWTKWYNRSYRTHKNYFINFLRNRTHMGSHWAGVAMYLNTLSADPNIKKTTAALVNQYDTLLKRNLKIYKGGYIWNSTYDDIRGTFAESTNANIIQDVSHGNHVVSYIIAAYQFGNNNWTLDDIKKLATTLKELIYDREKNTFKDNVDGTTDSSVSGTGIYIADGWIKLAEYDKDVKKIFKQFESSPSLKRFNQELQFKANLNN